MDCRSSLLGSLKIWQRSAAGLSEATGGQCLSSDSPLPWITQGCNVNMRLSRTWAKEYVSFVLFAWAACSSGINVPSNKTSCVRLREEEPQTAFPMSFTLASHTRQCAHRTLNSTQSITQEETFYTSHIIVACDLWGLMENTMLMEIIPWGMSCIKNAWEPWIIL